MSRESISVLILTLDEESNLAEAIASAARSDDIVVFDSHSTDRTQAIAAECGARLYCRRFDNYAAQRNAALHEVEYHNDWVLMLDADERVTPELWDEMITRIRHAGPGDTMFRMRRKDYFFGKWLRRSSGYPTWFGRLVRPGAVRVEREINEEYLTEGAIGHLDGHLLHFPFNKGLAYWFERHNKYSSAEAKKLQLEVLQPLRISQLIDKDPTVRRKAQKQLAYRLPFRPLLVFVYLYVIRLGFLDGAPGWRYCRMRAIYEALIDLKVEEGRARP
jgi:glycosyltransferase involved in cell wall biosynthesis